ADVIDVAADITAEEVEAVSRGVEIDLISEVPLANERGGIAGGFEYVGKGDFARPQSLAAIAGGEDDVLDAAALLVSAGHQRGAGRAAHGAVGVEVGEAQA